jgi:uncharacterized protein YdhG (YjbR/CyaY superfamily)
MSTEVEQYLAAVPEPSRSALESLRKTIREVVPDATESISYQVPTFRYQDRPVVAFGATETGCTFYVMSTNVFNAFKEKLKEFKTGKGSIRFQPDKLIPAEIVQNIVKARISENTGMYR